MTSNFSRRAILAGLASYPMASNALGQTGEALPTLRHGRGQFVELEPPAKVADFPLRRIDGSLTSLHRQLRRILIVNFWASWCPPCREELPILDKLAQQAESSTPRVIAISIDREGAASVRRFVTTLGLRHLPIFIDPDLRVARRADDATPQDPFRLFGLPLSYVLSADGRNLGYFPGFVDWSSSQATALLQALAAR